MREERLLLFFPLLAREKKKMVPSHQAVLMRARGSHAMSMGGGKIVRES